MCAHYGGKSWQSTFYALLKFHKFESPLLRIPSIIQNGSTTGMYVCSVARKNKNKTNNKYEKCTI